jgi:transaldolase/glucose-6-phosphate isomerase
MALRDIRDAAETLQPIYERSERRDGYVSLEVSPRVARDTQGTIEQARRLWQTVDRPNLMIKVPATAEGVPAVQQLIAEGINVNVTLLFSLAVYERVADSYVTALEARTRAGGDVSGVASVASFFVSRIDSSIDRLLALRMEAASSEHERAALSRVMGRTAIANAKLAYQRYLALFRGPRWLALAARGEKRSVCCGRARAPRMPRTATSSTSKS